jgi:flagella basal body P-ring formation protein FlgA
MAKGKRLEAFESKILFVGLLCCFITAGLLWGYSTARAESVMVGGDFPFTGIRIEIPQKTRVKGDRLYLKDIAKIRAPGDLAEKIGWIDLGSAPRPGAEKVLPGSWIVSRIHAGKPIPDASKISVPEYVSVTRESQSVSDERLRMLFEKYIAAKIKGGKFKVSRFKVRGERDFPSGKIDLIFNDIDRSRIIGHVTQTVVVNIGGKDSGRISLSGWIDRYEKIVCAKRSIPRGTVLSKDDLCLEEMNISKAPTGIVTSLADATGKLAKRRIKTGCCLKHRMLEEPPLVHEGDRVKLVVRTSLLTVSTVGVSKGRAGKGEKVQVENLASGKTVVGQVADESTVEVLF